MKYLCRSGGARGSDVAWGNQAKLAGHDLVHYSFVGHRPQALTNIVRLTPKQLLEADPYLVKAAPRLKKYYRAGKNPNDPDSGTPNLLRRNWWQVKDSDRVYAISTIKDGIVQGGTAWAVQMFIDRHQGQRCEAYVYEQEVRRWYRWGGPFFWWEDMSNVGPVDHPPRPFGNYAGIGTRDINQYGLKAIKDLYNVRN
jgi:hypothetical protein